MEKQITLYTRKEDLIEEVRERLDGTGVGVLVDSEFRGRFRDPRFVDHRGKEYIGYKPLIDYVEAIREGDENREIENSLGDAMQRSKKKPIFFFMGRENFGDYFFNGVV